MKRTGPDGGVASGTMSNVTAVSYWTQTLLQARPGHHELLNHLLITPAFTSGEDRLLSSRHKSVLHQPHHNLFDLWNAFFFFEKSLTVLKKQGACFVDKLLKFSKFIFILFFCIANEGKDSIPVWTSQNEVAIEFR